MIRLSKSTTSYDLELLIEDLGKDESESLSLPIAFNSASGFGLVPMVIQFLATWSRKQINPTLRVFSKNSTQFMLTIASTPHGAAAIYFSSEVEFNDKVVVKSTSLRKFIIPTLKAMQEMEFRQTIRGPGVQLASYAGSANEWIRPIYPNGAENSFRPKFRFSDLLESAVTSFNRNAISVIHREDLEYIGSILFELFQNTHQHGRRNLDGELYQKSVRSIYIRDFPFEEIVGGSLSALGVEIRRYISALVSSNRKTKQTPEANRERYQNLISKGAAPYAERKARTSFLELCVYDTGVGLVNNWRANRKVEPSEIEIQIDERQLIRECFVEGATSKRMPNSGMGLPNAIRSLSLLKAFLLLRTHNQCLYQDFTRPNSKEFEPKSISFKNGDELGLIYGTSFTLVIPI
jgi:hypothetical protein